MTYILLIHGVFSITLLFTFHHPVNCEVEELDNAHFTNSWAVHIENGDHKIADEIAEKHGFINYGQIGSLPGYFHFVQEKKESRRHRREVGKIFTLLSEEKIKWVEQQQVLERDKRSIVPEYVTVIHPTGYSVQDPLYNDQWYLNNVGQSSGPSNLDINVLPVWSRGISGKNVVVAILDDGLDHTHPDLRKNYDPTASYDFNDYDEDPMPRDSDPNNCHGTKCAGEVAAEAGNGVCGVGVAFNSSIAGIRMLDGNVTDTIEGGALSYKKDYIDIYSCAWGPKDDGKRFGRPGTLASKALELGVKDGRKGLGSIFIWATGNGGLTDDDCNCDGYTTSVYTVSIGAISDHGLSTYYTESCASTLAVTYSGGSHREKKENKIITTTLNHKCSSEFKGTSSAAPLAAGMVALMLEANGNLTWRDVQHIIVETSLMTSPLDEGWRRNGAGKWFNQKFGFGRMDASAMVDKAQNWNNVNKQKECWSDTASGPWSIPSSGTTVVSMNSSACADTRSVVKSLEHVQVVLTMRHRHRGHVSIELISPSGTRTRLLKTRRNDKSTKGLRDWIFMSVHFWGEDPRGMWTLAVTDNSNNNRQHHRSKSRYGDLEDATQILQDEIDGKSSPINENQLSDEGGSANDADKNSYKTVEELETSIFKDSSFRKNSKGRKHGVTKDINSNQNVHSQSANNVLRKLKEQKLLSKLKEKGRKLNSERLKQKLRKHRLTSLKLKKAHNDDNNQASNDDNNQASNDDNNQASNEKDVNVEEKLLEEILKEVQGEDEKSDKPSSVPNNMKINSPVNSSNPSLLDPTYLNTHNATTEVISPHPSHPSAAVNSSDVTTKSSSKHNTSAIEDSHDSSVIDNTGSTDSTQSGSTNTDSENKILEGLLRSVISQVFGGFLYEKDGKSFEERISALEALLGRNDSASDPITYNLQNALKSGSAIDRVNNVLKVLNNGKNETRFFNTSFSRNADIVIDVLKVLKDVLSTEKDNKNLKGYKQRISSLLEAQTHTTQKLTEKLLNDLKPSFGTNETNEGIVDDALALISQIFENRQRSTIGVQREPQTYRVAYNYPDSDSGTSEHDSDSDETPREITTARSSKEIQRGNDNHIEKITVERTKVKNKKKLKARKSDNIRFRETIDKSFNDNSFAEDEQYDESTSNHLFDDYGSSDKRHFDDTEESEHKKKGDGSFTITIMKNGDKSEKRNYPAEAPKLVDAVDVTSPTFSESTPSYDIQKKTKHTRPSNRNIDIEVVVDGKSQAVVKPGTIDLSRVVENINVNKIEQRGVARTHHDRRRHKYPIYLSNDNFKEYEDLVPKSLSYDLENKKTTVRSSPNKRQKNKTKKSIKYRNKFNKHDDENLFSFLQFNDPLMSAIPIIPDDMSENFVPSFDDNRFPIAPSSFFDTVYPTYEEEKASLYDDYHSNNDNAFETPFVQSQKYEVEKRSHLDHPKSDDKKQEEQQDEQQDLPELLSNLIHSRRRRLSHDDFSDDDVMFDDKTNNEDSYRSSKNGLTKRTLESPLPTDSTVKNHHIRHRRSVEGDDINNTSLEPTLYRQKRNIVDEDNDGDNDNENDEDDGPHVVKRSAIFSELYPSKQPFVLAKWNDDENQNNPYKNKEISRNNIKKEKTLFKNTTVTTPTTDVSNIKLKEIPNAKRSAIKKALTLESTLRRKLVSMRKESSSVLDIIKRVHTDIASSDSKDLRMLEKELSSLEPSTSSSPSSSSISSASRSSIEKTQHGEEPLEKLIKLMEQSENSSQRDEVVGPGETSSDGKQNPDEYYKYGTATSGILINWTLKFYGTG